MRTIKFKAKNRVGEWVKGDLLQYLDGSVYIGDNEGPWTDDGFHDSDYKNVEIVDHSTVCQFTGFLDKNGKEIYEGDVLRSDIYPFSCVEDDEYDNYYGTIGWSEYEASFYIVAIKNPKSSVRGISEGICDSISQKTMQDFEVVGSIHDKEWQEKLNLKDEKNMTKEQLEIAVELSRSLEQLELILDCLKGRRKDEVLYVSSYSPNGYKLEMPDILRTEFIIAVKDCIRRTENKIKEL